MASKPILIYGATGCTGRLIARLLHDRGLPLIISGRDRSLLAELAAELGAGVSARPAQLFDHDALVELLSDASVVISCAGPFAKLGEALVRAAIAAGCHYLDIANEPAFVRDIYERYDSAARHAGVGVVCAHGFEAAVADWLAAVVAQRFGCAIDDLGEDEGAIDELTIAYAVDGFRPSRAAQHALIDRLGAASWVWNLDRWEACPPAADPRVLQFPAPFASRQATSFPAADVITVPRHVRSKRVQTYLAVAAESPLASVATRLAALVAPALPALARSPLAAQARARIPASGPSAADRAQSRYAVVVIGERNFERLQVSAVGTDIFATTAAIATRAAIALASRDLGAGGVLTPAQLGDPAAALAAIGESCAMSISL